MDRSVHNVYTDCLSLMGKGRVRMARPQMFDRSAVLHQAMAVFWRKGYEATTMVDLLAATGLSKSSLYAAFGNKKQLFLAAFDAYRAIRAVQMQRLLAQGSAREAIADFFRLIIADAGALDYIDGCMSINEAVEMAPHDADIRQRVQLDFERIEQALLVAIQRGQEEGSVNQHKSAEELSQLLLLAFPGLQVMVRAGCSAPKLNATLTMLLAHLD